MSETITKCPNCGSERYQRIDVPKPEEQRGDTMTVTAKCMVCNETFKFLTWSELGERKRFMGLIW